MIICLYKIETSSTYRNDCEECYYIVSDNIGNALLALKETFNANGSSHIKDDEVFHISRVAGGLSLDFKAIRRVFGEDYTNK